VAPTLAAKPAVKSNDNRIAELRAEVGNLTDAIASGALRTSKALAERLSTAEAELDRLSIHKTTRKTNVVSLPIQLADRYRRIVSNLETELTRDVHKARTLLRQLVGNEISVVPHESGKHLVARIGLVTEALLQTAGGSEIFVVAGAGFGAIQWASFASATRTYARSRVRQYRRHAPMDILSRRKTCV
jgi:hypothetical protein